MLTRGQTTGDRRAVARPQEYDRRIGLRLRELRLERGLSQQEMADLLGVTSQQAHKYEKGDNRISAGRLWQAAAALKVEPGEFFTGAQLRSDQHAKRIRNLVLAYQRLPERLQREVSKMIATLAGEADGDEV